MSEEPLYPAKVARGEKRGCNTVQTHSPKVNLYYAINFRVLCGHVTT